MELDWSVGEIMTHIDAIPGMRDNTIVMFSSDNG